MTIAYAALPLVHAEDPYLMIPSPSSWTRSLAARSGLLACLALPFLPASTTHDLYMPRAVKRAYAKGTRSPDGRPGPNYWQNHGRYTMTVTAMPPDRTIRGSEQITYMNESPDTLRGSSSSSSSTSIAPARRARGARRKTISPPASRSTASP